MLDKIAKEYFESIVNYSDVHAFTQNRTPENSYLDFKVYNESKKDAERDLKRKLSKAASGFAHQHGGVIIWGIDARDTGAGDFAFKLSAINNLRKFLSLLNRLSRDALSPHLNITHEAIYQNDDIDKNTGFIKSFFPASYDIHRACFDNKYNFYQRIGDNHMPMSSKEELTRLMLRNRAPKLKLKVVVSINSHRRNDKGDIVAGTKLLTFALKNDGNEIAEFPSLIVRSPLILGAFDTFNGTSARVGTFFPVVGQDNLKQFIPTAGFVIHPNQEITVGSALQKNLKDIEITYECYAKNMPVIEGKIIT